MAYDTGHYKRGNVIFSIEFFGIDRNYFWRKMLFDTEFRAMDFAVQAALKSKCSPQHNKFADDRALKCNEFDKAVYISHFFFFLIVV